MSSNKEIPLEDWEQKTLVEWLRLKKIFHFAPVLENNSHKQNRKYAMIAEQKAKSQGKIKGTSDLFVFLPNRLVIIELKRRRKQLKNGKTSISHTKTSPEQLKFLREANMFDYVSGKVCYGWEEGKEFIERYI